MADEITELTVVLSQLKVLTEERSAQFAVVAIIDAITDIVTLASSTGAVTDTGDTHATCIASATTGVNAADLHHSPAADCQYPVIAVALFMSFIALN